MKLHFLTNENPLLQDKMRYFADYFLYVNEYLGKLPNLPFDNPVSLLDKIQFQIENNIERCPKSIDTYVSQLKFYPQKLTSQVSSSYKNFITSFLRNWNSFNKDTEKKNWLKNNPRLLLDITKIKQEFKKDLFEFSHKALYTFLICNHPLKKHKKDIQILTQIIITTFRFNGFTQQQVAKYIDRILTKDKYEFPLPLEILNEVENDSFENLRSNFLENRSFQNQFAGLKNILEAHNSRKGYFIYPINGIHLNERQQQEFIVKFDKVTFISSKHKMLRKLRTSVYQNDRKEKTFVKLYSIFFKRGLVLGFIEMNYEKKKDTAKAGKIIIDKELSLLKTYFNTTKLRLLNDDFLWSKNFTDNVWWGNVEMFRKNSHQHFPNEYEIKDASSNPFARLNQYQGKSSEFILFNEWVFLKAFSQDEISAYWLYIENLFWKKNLEKRHVRESFVNLSLNIASDLLKGFNSSIAFLTYNYYVPNPTELIGINENDVAKIFKLTRSPDENKDFNWNEYLPKIKHDFFNDVIQDYLKLCSKNALQQWKDYFANIAQELSDYRNSELHTGFVNEYSKIKMSFILPSLMNLLRWEIINFAELNPIIEHTQLIEELCKRGTDIKHF